MQLKPMIAYQLGTCVCVNPFLAEEGCTSLRGRAKTPSERSPTRVMLMQPLKLSIVSAGNLHLLCQHQPFSLSHVTQHGRLGCCVVCLDLLDQGHVGNVQGLSGSHKALWQMLAY